jgi:methionine--tRNA ligase beta chain
MLPLDDFKKFDIRVGKVLSVEKAPETDKLLKFIFDIGDGETRQILAGMAEFFPDTSILVGRQMPLLLNIEPRVLRSHKSEGMVLAAGAEGAPVFLHPEREIPPGSIVR